MISRLLRHGAFASLLFVSLGLPACADENARLVPAPQIDEAKAAQPGQETAVLSGGCFWGMQGVFQHVKGVTQVWAGYSGGARATAQYETVSTGTTGHAETVKIVFDPHVVSYGEILRVYFSVATDPTELNYQGPDEGSQYRSDIFYTSDAQKRVADAYVKQLSAAHVYGAPIVTRLDKFAAFYPAEDYHQDYLIDHPESLYIQTYDLPKVAALKRLFPGAYRAVPVMVHARS